MHRLFVAVVASVSTIAFAQIASAADMPVKAPVYKAAPVEVVPSWTGLYVGGGVGYGMYNADTIWSGPAPFPGFAQPLTQTQGGRGWLGTVTVGYDYQFNNNIVAGVLADYDFASIKGTITDQLPVTTGTMTENSAWAIGARAGWLVTPQILHYVNVGYTEAHFSSVGMLFNLAPPFVGLGTQVSTIPSQTYSGWFLGGGVEANVAPGWFWRNEYRYASYGSKTLLDTCTAPAFCGGFGPPDVVSIHPYVQTVRSEIVYKFNSGGSANTYSPPPPAPVSWTGLYVGGGVDYGMYNADTIWSRPLTAPVVATPFLAPLTQTQGGRGWLGTVTVGYDYQFNSNIVAGVLADFDFASIKGTIQDVGTAGVGTMTENSAWAIGARAGWLVTPQILPYVNGGYTEAHFSSIDMDWNFQFPGVPPVGTVAATIPSQTYSGWFIGGGVETKLPWFGDGWFTRTEYRYASYGGRTLTETCTNSALCVVPDLVSIHPYVQTVRSELVYKFNWGR